MKLPGFTAETSIYNSTVTYRPLSAGAGVSSTSVTAALVGGTVGGIGGGTGVGPCFGTRQCSACIPTGPTIFGRGRQFCIITDCSPTISGCRCRLLFKGFLGCTVPFPNVAANVVAR